MEEMQNLKIFNFLEKIIFYLLFNKINHFKLRKRKTKTKRKSVSKGKNVISSEPLCEDDNYTLDSQEYL